MLKGENTKVFVSKALKPSIVEVAKKLTTANSFNRELKAVEFNPAKLKFWG